MTSDSRDSFMQAPGNEAIGPPGSGVGFDKQGCLAEIRKNVLNCCLFFLVQFAIVAVVFFAVAHQLRDQGGYQLWQCALAALLASLLGLAILDTGLLVMMLLPMELSDALEPRLKNYSGILHSAYVLTCLWGVMIGAATGAYSAQGWLWSCGYLVTITVFSWLIIYLALEWKLESFPSCLGGLSLTIVPFVIWHLSAAPYSHWWVGGMTALIWSELMRQIILKARRNKTASSPHPKPIPEGSEVVLDSPEE